MKRAFTLVEMLVVLGILGILLAVLIGGFAGSTESARATKCMSNLRNLSAAWSGGRAGSQEHLKITLTRNGVRNTYMEERGWISSATKGLYPSESHQTFEPIGMFEKDVDLVEYALANGWMSSALGKDRNILICPTHRKKLGTEKTVNWSYFMNAAFGWDAAQGEHSYINGGGGLSKAALTNADRLLIFAEIPFQGPGDWFPSGDSGSTETDAILQFNGCDKCATASGPTRYNGQENIGGNHKSGRNWFAHVAFADGHVEKLRVDGLTGDNLKELTTWLCQGQSVGRRGNKYEEIK